MREDSGDKVDRILSIYSRLKEGHLIYKEKEREAFGITERTLQRDMADIQAFLKNQIHENGMVQEIRYDRSAGGYRMVTRKERQLRSPELMAVCLALLEGNSLVREEVLPILGKLLNSCEEDGGSRQVRDLIVNASMHYRGPDHGKKLLDTLWILNCAIEKREILKISYREDKDRETITKRVQPVQVTQEGEYYYLTGFSCENEEQMENQSSESGHMVRYRLDCLKVIEFPEDEKKRSLITSQPADV